MEGVSRHRIDPRTIRAEHNLREECIRKNKLHCYIEPPDNDLRNETPDERKVRRRKIRIALEGDDERVERLAKARIEYKKRSDDVKSGGVRRPLQKNKPQDCTADCVQSPCAKASEGKCKYMTPPKKETIEIANLDPPERKRKYSTLPKKETDYTVRLRKHDTLSLKASANVNDAHYASVEDASSLGYEIQYHTCDDQRMPHHMFSINLEIRRSLGSLRDMKSRAICINGVKVCSVKDCTHTTAQISSRPDYLLIKYHYTFNHGDTPWGWYESFSLNLYYGPLPKDLIADVDLDLQMLSSKYTADIGQKLQNHHDEIKNAYTLQVNQQYLPLWAQRRNEEEHKSLQVKIDPKDLPRIEQIVLHFRETSMKWGDPLHFIAWKAICEKKEGRAMTEDEVKMIEKEMSNEPSSERYRMIHNPFRSYNNNFSYDFNQVFTHVICLGLKGELAHLNGKIGKRGHLLHFFDRTIPPCEVPLHNTSEIRVVRGHVCYRKEPFANNSVCFLCEEELIRQKPMSEPFQKALAAAPRSVVLNDSTMPSPGVRTEYKTIWDCIVFLCGKMDASPGEVFDAAKKSRFHDIIRTWPNGYDTKVAESALCVCGHHFCCFCSAAKSGSLRVLSCEEKQCLWLACSILKGETNLDCDEIAPSFDSPTEIISNMIEMSGTLKCEIRSRLECRGHPVCDRHWISCRGHWVKQILSN